MTPGIRPSCRASTVAGQTFGDAVEQRRRGRSGVLEHRQERLTGNGSPSSAPRSLLARCGIRRTVARIAPDTAKVAAVTTKPADGDNSATTTPSSGPTKVITWRIVLSTAFATARCRSPAIAGTTAESAGRVGAATVYDTAMIRSTTGAPTSRDTITASVAISAAREHSIDTISRRKLLRSTSEPAGRLRSARGARRAMTAIVSQRPNCGWSARNTTRATQKMPSPAPETASGDRRCGTTLQARCVPGCPHSSGAESGIRWPDRDSGNFVTSRSRRTVPGRARRQMSESGEVVDGPVGARLQQQAGAIGCQRCRTVE